MANVLTQNIWNCDSLGILSKGPVLVKAIMFTGTAQAHAFELKWWNEGSRTTEAIGVTYTITDSTDDTVTATTNAFPNTWLDGNVVKCEKTTGSDTGKYGLIKTAGNNTAFVTHLMPFTTEASKVGDWVQYTTYTAFKGTQPTDTNEQGLWYTFPGDGFWFPNLALDSLSAGSIQIYVG